MLSTFFFQDKQAFVVDVAYYQGKPILFVSENPNRGRRFQSTSIAHYVAKIAANFPREQLVFVE